jgi:hypothetical protein
MSFPLSPTGGQIATLNGINYVYSSTDTSWTRVLAQAITPKTTATAVAMSIALGS